MKLIMGLGNIGRQYKDTPHNVGFEFLHVFRKKLIDKGFKADDWKNENSFHSELCKVRGEKGIEYLLAKPTTFMNLSGRALGKLLDKYKFDEVVVIHDDLDIKVGEYKIQRGKGPKAHNGVNSIEGVVGSSESLRVRIGVESRVDNSLIPGDVFVIKKMSKGDIETLNEVIQDASNELLTLV